MKDSNSKLVEQSLSKPDIHRQWEEAYRNEKNEMFYEQAFDYITRYLNNSKNSTVLDAGCGICAHTIRLANRGIFVQAIDFSESVLKEAAAEVNARGLENRINIKRENILDLSYENRSFNNILCWGVLMHIPDLEKAISELTRVLKSGGTLVISESNMYSLQSIIVRNMRRFLGKRKIDVKKTPAGVEYWGITPVGVLMVRETNIQWLIEKFKKNRFTVIKHVAGQFTELYTRVSSQPLENLIHGFNNFWFRYVKIPHLAFGNIIILRKEE